MDQTLVKRYMRECLIPRPGYWFLGIDFKGLELHTWAQVCIWAVGQSRMAQVLNEGLDPHTELGARCARITKEEAYRRRETGDKEFEDQFRQVAKIGNFGYQGGMGPKTLRRQARKQYRVFLTLEQCQDLRSDWKLEWPEAYPYLQWISDMTGEGTTVIRQFVSNRLRGAVSYTQAANGFFQGLAGDAAKASGFALAKACYVGPGPLVGCFPVGFFHDEFLLEVPAIPERAHLAAEECQRVVLGAAQVYTPDVRLKGDPILMERYSKRAKQVREQGMIVPWREAA